MVDFILKSIYFLPKAAPKKPDTGPGPGSYELQNYEGIKSRMEKAAGKPSSTFIQRDFTDRFGRPLVADLSGSDRNDARAAGAQTVSLAQRPIGSPPRAARIAGPQRGVSAPFRSQAPGRDQYDLKEATKAPGPAYYSPEFLARKTSHHMNARKRMVPVV